MYLLIDNSTEHQIIIHYYINNSWQKKEFFLDELSLVGVIENLLKNENITLSGLEGLAVVISKGRFTATRVAVTTVNTLAFALKIPVVAVTEWSPNLLKKIKETKIGQYVTALYSAEANIGRKK